LAAAGAPEKLAYKAEALLPSADDPKCCWYDSWSLTTVSGDLATTSSAAVLAVAW
jgi:hypothetical protein